MAVATTHVVDDVAYVTATDSSELVDYSESAVVPAVGNGMADGVYADMYAQGAVNTYMSTSGSGGYVDDVANVGYGISQRNKHALQNPVVEVSGAIPDQSSGYVDDTTVSRSAMTSLSARTPSPRSNGLSAVALPLSHRDASHKGVEALSHQQRLIETWLQLGLTGVQAEKALRPFTEGHFCVRKSKSSIDCVVLSVKGPNDTVHHYQFKKVCTMLLGNVCGSYANRSDGILMVFAAADEAAATVPCSILGSYFGRHVGVLPAVCVFQVFSC